MPPETGGRPVSLATILALPEGGRVEIRRSRERRGPGGVWVGMPVWGSGVRGGGFQTQEPR